MIKKERLGLLNQWTTVFSSSLVTLPLLCFPSWGSRTGVIQYKPISSPERHEITIGWTFKKPIPSFASQHRAAYFSYSLYFPEVTALLPKPWNDIGAPGLSFGARLFKEGHQLCGKEKDQPLFTHLGLKAKVSYFETVIPFAEYGTGWMSCIQNLTLDREAEPFKHSAGPIKIKSYLALGLNLSLKILGKKAIYSLDQDYGLNDIGIQVQCRWYRGTQKTLTFCEAGLSVLF